MSGNVLLFLSMRVLHVLLAGIWLGSVFFLTLFLMPATEDTGPSDGQIMAALVGRGLVTFMAALGGTVILTGFYLFWRFTSGFDPAVSGSRAGISFSIGALAGVVALIVGGSMVGRSAKKAAAIAPKIATLPEGAERTALMNEMTALGNRMGTFGRIVLVLLVIAMAAMALGHYI